jgi:transcriptional regulator with XRE-family HTH domain
MEGMAAPDPVGLRIKRARERKRWTQVQLADAIGVTQKTIDNWEHDRSYPKSAIGALEDVLGVSLDGDGAEMRIVSPRARRVLRQELDDEDYRRVIGLLEGTLTWPAGETQPEAAAAGEAQGDGRPAG